MDQHINISKSYENMSKKLYNVNCSKNNVKYNKTSIINNINNDQYKNYSENTSIHRTSKNLNKINLDHPIINNASVIDFYKNDNSIIQDINSTIFCIQSDKENNQNHQIIPSLSKSMSKLENNIQKIFLVKCHEKEKDANSLSHPFLCHDFKHIAEWKKAISQQTLFFIFQKENIAEIQIGPKCLKPIYIKIQINNDQATVNFISNHLPMKHFLYNAIPFLRDSLVKNGVKIDKINIHSVVHRDNQEVKIKNLKNKNILKIKDVEKVFYFQEKNITHLNFQGIDVYV